MESIDLRSAHLVPAPGTEGWLCRTPGAIVWAPSTGPEAGELISACLGVGGPAELLGRVGARLADPNAAPWPPFAIVAVRGRDLVAVVHGPVEVVVRRDGAEEVLRGGDDVGSWLHRVLHGVAAARSGKPTSGEAYANLRDGVVLAGGFALLTSESAAGETSERAAGERVAAAAVAGAAEEVTVLEEPVVLGSSTAPEPARPRRGARASRGEVLIAEAPTVAAAVPLGKLTWDNGDVHELSGPALIGRDVTSDEQVRSGELSPITPSGQNDSMSRVHAELRPAGNEVVVIDRGSTNGTFVWDDVSRAWQRLSPGEPQRVASGAVLAFGERTATFEGVVATVG
jgi:hypothetical protein